MRLQPDIATMATMAIIATLPAAACASRPPGAELRLTASP